MARTLLAVTLVLLAVATAAAVARAGVVGDGDDGIIDISEGELYAFSLTGKESIVLRFRNNNNLENGVAYYELNNDMTYMYVCKDDPCDCEDESVDCDDPNSVCNNPARDCEDPTKSLLLISGKKKMDLESKDNFVWQVDTYYISIYARGASEGTIQVFTTPEALEGVTTQTDLSQFDWASNDGYRFYHAFFCGDGRDFIRFQTDGASTYGAVAGILPKDGIEEGDLICTGTGDASSNVCNEQNTAENPLESGFYNFSLKQIANSNTYKYLYKSMEPIPITPEKVFEGEVSIVETCKRTYYVDVHDIAKGTSIMVTAWSKDADATKKIKVTVSEGDADSVPSNAVSYDDMVTYKKVDGVDTISVSLEASSPKYHLSALNIPTFDFGGLVSTTVRPIQKDVLYSVSGDDIQNKTNNSFIMITSNLEHPVSENQFIIADYDIIFFAYITSTGEPKEYDIAARLDLNSYNSSGTDYKYESQSIDTFNGESLSQKGAFYTQGKLPHDSFGYENPTAFLTVVNKSTTELTGDTSVIVGMEPLYDFHSDRVYVTTLYPQKPKFLRIEMEDEYTRLELKYIGNASNSNKYLTVRCSRDVYAPIDKDVDELEEQLMLDQMYVELDKLYSEDNKIVYCSIWYNNKETVSNDKAIIGVTVHTNKQYFDIYEGSTNIRTISNETNAGDTASKIAKFKLIPDSVDDSGNMYDIKASKYDTIFVKLELISSGEDENATTIDEEDELLFCISDSEDITSCPEPPQHPTISSTTTSNVADYKGTTRIIEANVQYKDSVNVTAGFLPSSTYIVVDSRKLKSGHVATYNLIIGYAASAEYEDILEYKMEYDFTVYYNNIQEGINYMHPHFVKVHLVPEDADTSYYLTQLSYNVQKGATSSTITTPDDSCVLAILCPNYPMLTVPTEDSEIKCTSAVINANEENKVDVVDGASTSTSGSIQDWYLTLYPSNFNTKYIPYSLVHLKLENVLRSNKMTVGTISASQTTLAYAIQTEKDIEPETILSIDLYSEDLSTLSVYFSATTPIGRDESDIFKVETKTSDGNKNIEVPYTAELIESMTETPNKYNGLSYMYITLVGAAKEGSTENNILIEYTLRTTYKTNESNDINFQAALAEDNTTFTTSIPTLYFPNLDNKLTDNMNKLVLLVEPPRVEEGNTVTPNFYENSTLQITVTPGSSQKNNSSDIVGTSSFTVEKLERGLIVYKLGEELQRIEVNSLEDGLLVTITPVYDTYNVPSSKKSVDYSVIVGIFYEDIPDYKVASLIQANSDTNMHVRTTSSAIDTNSTLLSNSVRIPPTVEYTYNYSDFKGLILMPCKGLPTVYSSTGSSTNTMSPSSDNHDDVFRYASDDSYNRGSLIRFNASEKLNQYYTVEIETDSTIEGDSQYSYYLMGDTKNMCLPVVSGSTVIKSVSPVTLNDEPYVTISFEPANVPQDCMNEQGLKNIVEYTMYHYKLESSNLHSDVSDISAYEVMPTYCGMMNYGTPSIVDEKGNPLWQQVDTSNSKATLTSNVFFDIVDENDTSKEIQYVFNILARVKDATENDHISLSYDGLIVKSSDFNSIQDGFKAEIFKGIIEEKVITLSPTVNLNESENKLHYYAHKFLAELEVVGINGTTTMDSIVCINSGAEECVSDKESEPRAEFTASVGTRKTLIFDINENPSGVGLNSIVNYSLAYAPINLAHPNNVDISVFGVSLIDLYSQSYLSGPTNSFSPTKKFHKISDDVTTNNVSMDVGFIDLRVPSQGSLTSLPNVSLSIKLDPNESDNKHNVNPSSNTYGIHVSLCSNYIETNPELYTGSSQTIGQNCAYLGKLSTSTTASGVTTLNLDIPFGHNSATGKNTVFVNGAEKNISAGNSFNIQREGEFYLVMVTENILPGFVWDVTTSINFPIDITIASNGERHETIISTPKVRAGKNVYATVYNDNTQSESDQDICGLFIYPYYRTTTSFSANVCVSSKTRYPSQQNNECDISYSIVSDVNTYIEFPCRNGSTTDGQTYFNIEMTQIMNNLSSFILEVVRAEKLSSAKPAVSFLFGHLFNLVNKDGQYYCGYNPMDLLDTSAPIETIPADCITKYAYFYDATDDVAKDNFDSFTVYIEPPMTDDKVFYTDYSYDDNPDHVEGIFYLYGSGEQRIMNTRYLLASCKSLHTKGMQILSFYENDITPSEAVKRSFVGFGIQINPVKIGDFISFYNKHKDDKLTFSVEPVTVDPGETGVVSLDGDGIEDISVVYKSTLNPANTPMYYSMYMTTHGKSIDISELIVSPCVGNPVIVASPYTMHPTDAQGQFEMKIGPSDGKELRFALEKDVDTIADNTIWSININSDTETMYELYANNQQYRPVQATNTLSIMEPTDREKDAGALFALEFGYFTIPSYDNEQADKEREGATIKYRLYGFEDKNANYKATCACTYNGKSLYVNPNTGVDYMVRSQNGEAIIRILANNSKVNLDKIRKVVVVAEYELENGSTWKSNTDFVNVEDFSSDGLPWWAYLLIVLFSIVAAFGIGMAIYYFLIRKRKQRQYLVGGTNEISAVPSSEADGYTPRFVS